jgi:hypothetical protein
MDKYLMGLSKKFMKFRLNIFLLHRVIPFKLLIFLFLVCNKDITLVF